MYRAMRGSLLICALLLSISGMAEAVQHTTAIYQLESTTATFLRVHLSREGLQNLKNEKSPYHLAIISEANSFHHEQCLISK